MRVTYNFGKTIGVEPITNLKNKYSNYGIDKALYDINDTLYFFKNLYITSKAKKYLMEKITAVATELNNLELEEKKKARRNEIVDRLREIYKGVSKQPNMDDERFPKLVGDMGKFRLAIFLKDKENDRLNKNLTIKYLYENLLFTQIYGKEEHVQSIQKELLNNFDIK